MKLGYVPLAVFLVWCGCCAALAESMPDGFVYLRTVAPAIYQDIRYYGRHNFVGRPIAGYLAPECILTAPAARALAQVQAELAASNLSLLVYDCYRPQRAVDDFKAWSLAAADQATKAEFYPRVDKADFFKLGYVADKSGHTRGSTVDLAIVPLPFVAPRPYAESDAKIDCAAPANTRFRDGSLDFGTAFDCMDEASHIDATSISPTARHNRALLHELMLKYGFKDYHEEWWHYTLRDEPFPDTYFDFPITASPR
jgi:D-alanyl-D-alanine dipeptidase